MTQLSESELRIGDPVRLENTAIGRYLGDGKALFVSAMTNDLVIGVIKKPIEVGNPRNLPVPSDSDVQKHVDMTNVIMGMVDLSLQKKKTDPTYIALSNTKSKEDLIFMAERLMRGVALSAGALLRDTYGVEMDKENLMKLYSLPALAKQFEEEEKQKTWVCSVDRAYKRLSKIFD